MTTTHPTDREPSDFILGRLSGLDRSAVESHFADCVECGDRARDGNAPEFGVSANLVFLVKSRVRKPWEQSWRDL